jgi:hypothetical protein
LEKKTRVLLFGLTRSCLPQPGVSIIALEAMRVHKLAVPIVPVGMQYFEGDKFRGRSVELS